MRSPGLLGFAFASLVLSCGGSGKDDVSSLPDAVTDDSKADSLGGPARGGTLRVGEPGAGSFTGTRGWVGYEVELTAGAVEMDLAGVAEDGSELDTVVYLFGPKRPTNRYPREVLALNDDAGPGDYHSHLSAEVPADGTYRVVVSTYDNYWAWPTNVSRGDYELSVSCPRPGFGACGPAVSPVGGACWEDGECLGGAHCEGEITCPEGTMCLWVRGGACVADYEWLTYAPRQCLSNSWDVEGGAGDGESPSYPIEELQAIDDHFESKGIDLLALGLVQHVEPMLVCLACSCPRGDRLVVKASPTDHDALVAEGFVRLESGQALQAAPTQCDSNPWEETSSPIDEGKNLAVWAEAQGVSLAEVGFLYQTEARFQCLACNCARGDTALVFPAAPEAAAALSSFGFGEIYID